MALGRVERRMERTRERIVRAAMDLFASKGFDATTIAEISDAADVGKGTFFTYFPSKDAVLSHLGRQLLARMSGAAAQAIEGGLERRLLAYFGPACTWHESNRALSRLVALVTFRGTALAEADEPNVLAFAGALAGLVREAQRASEVDDSVDPDAAATLLAGAYMSAFSRWHAGGARGSLAEILAASLALAMDGIRARPGRRARARR